MIAERYYVHADGRRVGSHLRHRSIARAVAEHEAQHGHSASIHRLAENGILEHVATIEP